MLFTKELDINTIHGKYSNEIIQIFIRAHSMKMLSKRERDKLIKFMGKRKILLLKWTTSTLNYLIKTKRIL